MLGRCPEFDRWINEMGEIRKEGIEKGESLKSLLIQI